MLKTRKQKHFFIDFNNKSLTTKMFNNIQLHDVNDAINDAMLYY